MGGGADTAMLNYHHTTLRHPSNSRDTNSAAEQGNSALSPLRKAMSLSTLFRGNGAAGNAASVNSVPNNSLAGNVGNQMAIPPTTMATTTTITPPMASKPLGRMRRRLSLRSSSTASPATSSALTSPTISTPPGSTSSASVRGRPRSGSCRASLLSGGARILPFTLPTLGQTEDEDQLSHGGRKDNRFGADMTRISFTSPSVAPRRPMTPAPLLVLNEDQSNCLGITGDSAITPQSAIRTQGLGLSAPLVPSASSSSSSRASFTNPLLRLSMASALNESKESFQCRGDEAEETWSGASIPLVKPTAAPQMTRSASANPVSSSSSSGQSTTSTAIMPGSSLGWRRRPWALSLQLQSSAKPTVPPVNVQQTPHSANPYVKSFAPSAAFGRHDGDMGWDSPGEVVDPRSRFSLSSSNVDMDADEDDELCGRASASHTTSPAFTWSSSALSFDTTLGSPESRHSNRFVNQATDPQTTPQRGRSNTIAAIPIYKPSSDVTVTPGTKAFYEQNCLTAATAISSFEDRRPSSIANEIRGYCPASPPSHVRLRLTFPPTAVAKNAGVPQEQTVQMAMTASTLDFKEAICLSLRTRHRLSISPSQLALFVVDDGAAAAASATPSTLSTSPQSPRSFTRPFSPTMSEAQAAGSLRSRSRLRRRLSINQQPQTSSAAAAGATIIASSSNRLTPPSAYRQLQNDVGLYEQGLQDDDKIIVRF